MTVIVIPAPFSPFTGRRSRVVCQRCGVVGINVDADAVRELRRQHDDHGKGGDTA